VRQVPVAAEDVRHFELGTLHRRSVGVRSAQVAGGLCGRQRMRQQIQRASGRADFVDRQTQIGSRHNSCPISSWMVRRSVHRKGMQQLLGEHDVTVLLSLVLLHADEVAILIELAASFFSLVKIFWRSV